MAERRPKESLTFELSKAAIRSWRGIVLQVDLVLAAAGAAAISILPTSERLSERLDVMMQAQIGVGASILGLVLAALAIILSYLRDDILILLGESDEGLYDTFLPFWFTSVLAVLATVVPMAALLLLPCDGEVWLRRVTTTLTQQA